MAMAEEIRKAKEERLTQDEQRRGEKGAAKKPLNLTLNGLGLCGDVKVLPTMALSKVILKIWFPLHNGSRYLLGIRQSRILA